MNHQKTPLYEALIKHNNQEPISLHVPGHKNGSVFPSDALKHYQTVLSLDVTELVGLDDLHSPDGVIKEAEALLAFAYQSKQSFFLINGSTVGNLTMILASFNEGDVVFVQRNCHKSVLNGLKLAKLKPIFIETDYDEEWNVATGVSKANLEAAFRAYPNGKGVILTYPNYYGFTFDIKAIIDFCHSHHMVVLVDEAHGAHFIVGDPFPPSALQLGADMVVQSAHKTLPAMTMSAYLHLNSEKICSDKVRYYLQALQSSSPSYPLMASLDLARSYVATYNLEDKQYLIEQLSHFIKELEKLSNLKVLHHNQDGDPLKIAIQSTKGISGFELQKQLEEAGIYTELADSNNVLFVMPLLKNDAPHLLCEVVNRLRTIQHTEVASTPAMIMNFNETKEAFTGLLINYIDQLDWPRKVIPLSESIGKSSAEMIIPYPPGIPLLMEGEEITVEKVEELLLLKELGAKFHGGEFLSELNIKVFE